MQGIESEYSYYLDEPEDRRFKWITVRNKIGEVEQVVARYGDRCATEQVARLMSLEDHAIYQVKEERDNGKKGLSFQQGGIFIIPYIQ